MKKVTILDFAQKKRRGERITMLTAYDATFARLVDRAGVDAILVGDSLGMVVQGGDNTLGVTLDDVVYHTRAVARARRRALLVADMPFMSYQVGPEAALRAAGRLLAEGGAEAVKLEGGAHLAETVRRLVQAGIPVMGHLGLTPQSVHALGGFVVQGKSERAARRIVDDARCLQEAGCFALVLESVPVQVARAVTRSLAIPTIGIGAGPECDGQVLVVYDMLGLDPDFKPRFVKRYAELGEAVERAVAAFVDDVRKGTFPGPEHSFRGRDLPELDDRDGDAAEVLSLYSTPSG